MAAPSREAHRTQPAAATGPVSRQPRYRIRFPRKSLRQSAQDETYFHLDDPGGKRRRIRFHDYAEIYRHPGLYEQLFYERLRCQSPSKVADILRQAVTRAGGRFTESRVLDVGAGNGIVGESLTAAPRVARLVGVDIIPEARDACERDRPGIYDAYYALDLTNLDEDTRQDLRDWQFDVVTCVAALGFGDIPTRAFTEAFNLTQDGGWVAFNINKSFLASTDSSGFSKLVRSLLFSDILELHHLERYVHRISIDGEPLYYCAVVGRKERDISPDLVTD